jgi:diguanylate cyclase (GGDEF)-like protein
VSMPIRRMPRCRSGLSKRVAKRCCVPVEEVFRLKYQNKRLRDLSYVDSMTGIPNFRALTEFLVAQINKTIRTAIPTAIIMIDIDDFKRINDSYGHLVGDIVLKEIAKVIKNSIRASDQVFRYGGEEFTVVLPQTQLDEAIKVAERIRRNIELHQLCKFNENNHISVTASLGVSTITPSSSHLGFNAAIDSADKLLIEAKRSGKNTVMWESKAVKEAEVSKEERKIILEALFSNDSPHTEPEEASANDG